MLSSFRVRAAIAALCLGAAAYGGWWVRGNQADAEIAGINQAHAKAMTAISNKAAEAATDALLQEQAWQRQVAELDAKHTKEMEDAKAEIDSLRTGLRTGAVRVRVPAKCAAGSNSVPQTASAPSVDHGAIQAELDPAFAEQLAGIAADGDAAARKLTALQEYVRGILKGGDPVSPAAGEVAR